MLSCSVALATFNGQRYLQAQLDSIVRQVTAPSEIVIADDGSSDDTLRIAYDFARRAPFPVRIIENTTQLGYRCNFMQAATECKSDLIAFCDQDDLWEPTKLSVMLGVFHDPSVLLAYHDAELIDDTGAIIGRTFRQSRARTFKPLTLGPSKIIPGLVQVVRRSLVRLTSLHAYSIDPYAPDEPMPHDHWYPFWASVLGNILYVPQSLVHYRQHDSNASGWPLNLQAFVLDNIRNAKSYACSSAIGAVNRLDLLRRARSSFAADEIARIDGAISYYEDYCKTTHSRRELYEARTIAARAKSLQILFKHGAYTSERSHDLGRATLLLDAFIGLPFAAYGPQQTAS